MCWHGKDNRKIANADIPVFKIVCGNPQFVFTSYYRQFIYKIGSIYSSRIKKILAIYSGASCLSIGNGLHSYSNDCKIIKDTIRKKEDSCFVNCRGDNLDFYFGKDESELYKLECVIPRGSAYYKNDRGEMVSSRLKILKAIKL